MTLREFRAYKGLTLQQLADLLGKPFSTVVPWENGTRCPRWNDIPGITKATGGAVTAMDFVPKVEADAG